MSADRFTRARGRIAAERAAASAAMAAGMTRAMGRAMGRALGRALGRATACAATALLAAVPMIAGAQTWDFEVRLDDKPVGTHRFVVSGPPTARAVESNARFDVKLLGFTVYRYRHEARERWRGDCLAEIHARTDDDGKARVVDARAPAPAETATASAPGTAPSETSTTTSASGQVGGEVAPIPGCVMSYAYWHPALVRQTRLLNPQTGQIDDARFERMPDASLRVGGREVPAIRWHLSADASGTRQDLTLWLAREDGRWIGLDARVKGGRLLTYRLP
ncbi:DUF6134 family protein [Roseateles chitosanitabidus]|uniref:DUF6134 family protein n=1 Tax=Roseateles chitosanitabidus TaxID=65048 RepID=UPI000B1E2E32|nr:DUF6134 family protein [Roseateles chitosanitabidus]